MVLFPALHVVPPESPLLATNKTSLANVRVGDASISPRSSSCQYGSGARIDLPKTRLRSAACASARDPHGVMNVIHQRGRADHVQIGNSARCTGYGRPRRIGPGVAIQSEDLVPRRRCCVTGTEENLIVRAPRNGFQLHSGTALEGQSTAAYGIHYPIEHAGISVNSVDEAIQRPSDKRCLVPSMKTQHRLQASAKQ